MRAILLLVSMCAACSPTPDPDPDMGADAGPDVSIADEGTPQVDFILGERTEPFATRQPNADVIAVFGPQGGVHTEHSAFIADEELETLHLALIWAEVSRDGRVLARAGWEFWNIQWKEAEDGYSVELPVLIFDDIPTSGPIVLRGELELADGRTALYEEPFNLVVE